jgi:hypothetical protein
MSLASRYWVFLLVVYCGLAEGTTYDSALWSGGFSWPQSPLRKRLRNHPAGKDEFLGFSIPTTTGNIALMLPILTPVSEGWLILKLSVNIICILQLDLSISYGVAA